MHTICLKNPVPFSLLKIKPKKWIYVGTHYQQTVRISEQLLPYGIEQITINKLFYDVSQQHKTKVNNLLSKISMGFTHLTEWTTQLANRSAYTCTLIQEIFLLLTVDTLLKSAEEPFLIIIESAEIFTTLQKQCAEAGEFFDIQFSQPARKSSLRTIIHNRTEFIIQQLQHRQKVKASIPDVPITLIGVWLNYGIIQKENPFETYFGMLAEYLSSEQTPLYYMGYIWDHDHHALIKENITQRFSNILFPEDWQSIRTILNAASQPLFKLPLYKTIAYDEYDITDLVNKQQKLEFSNPYNSACLLLYSFFQNLKKKNVQIERFIYPFENQPWEKVCIKALRDFFPDTKIIGFKHTTIPQFMLGHFPASEELLHMPRPDAIVTCGKSSYLALKEKWEPAVKVLEGCALRHSHLFEQSPAAQTHQTDTCGVAFSIDANSNSELLDIILESSHQLPVQQFLIKLHPAADNRNLIDYLTEHNTGNISIFKGTPDEFLAQIHLLVITATDLAVQAAIKDIPVLCYGGMGKLDMNPQDDSFITQRIFDAESLCSSITKYKDKKRVKSAITLSNYYNPLEDKYLKNFTGF